MSDYTQYYICNTQLCKYFHWYVKYASDSPKDPTCNSCQKLYDKVPDNDNLISPHLLTGQ